MFDARWVTWYTADSLTTQHQLQFPPADIRLLMYEVTCFHCGHVAHISPDAHRCAACGEDLRHLITPDYAVRYFYKRASEMAAAGEVTLALLEAERGLDYQSNAELHLLAAILSQRLGDYAQMRQHVSSIPVDDVLRPEAEWLLRSQQATMRSSREAYKAQRTVPTGESLPTWSAPPPARPLPPPRLYRTNPWLYGAVALGLVAMLVWLTLEPIGEMIQALLPSGAGDVAQMTVTPLPVDAQAATPEPALTPSPTPNLPDDVVQPPTQEAVAAITPIDLTGAATFDLTTYLTQTTRPDLATLGVGASLQGSTLKLQGIVELFDQRQALIDLGQQAPGVSEVDAVDLLIRLPATYTVQPGESLWVISYKLYGTDRIADLFAANRGTMASAEAVRVGQVLQVPP